MPQVTISGWRPGLQKVSMTRTLQEAANLPLDQAKACADRVLADEAVTVIVDTPEKARALVKALSDLGAIATDA